MKTIEGMEPHIIDIERRIDIMEFIEPVLKNAIETFQKVVDVLGMGVIGVGMGDDSYDEEAKIQVEPNIPNVRCIDDLEGEETSHLKK